MTPPPDEREPGRPDHPGSPGSRVPADPDHWYREFASRVEGMCHAMDGGLWLHHHVWQGHPMAHLVSTDRGRLLAYGRVVGLPPERLQFKPLKDPRTGERRDAWHWDLVGPWLPARGKGTRESGSGNREFGTGG